MPPSEQVKKLQGSSVEYMDPDPYVFGPPGSGSVSTRYGSGSGSGSIYHQAEIVKKNLDSYCFVSSLLPFIFEKLCKCIFKKL